MISWQCLINSVSRAEFQMSRYQVRYHRDLSSASSRKSAFTSYKKTLNEIRIELAVNALPTFSQQTNHWWLKQGIHLLSVRQSIDPDNWLSNGMAIIDDGQGTFLRDCHVNMTQWYQQSPSRTRSNNRFYCWNCCRTLQVIFFTMSILNPNPTTLRRVSLVLLSGSHLIQVNLKLILLLIHLIPTYTNSEG